MEAALLVELLTEELPPKSLEALSRNFGSSILESLKSHGLVAKAAAAQFFCTPRRLAVLVPHVQDAAGDSVKQIDGPPVSAKPEAIAGFARKQGLEPSAL